MCDEVLPTITLYVNTDSGSWSVKHVTYKWNAMILRCYDIETNNNYKTKSKLKWRSARVETGTERVETYEVDGHDLHCDHPDELTPAVFRNIQLSKYGHPTVCCVALNLLDAAPDLIHHHAMKQKASKCIPNVMTDTVITHIMDRPNRTWIRCHKVKMISYWNSAFMAMHCSLHLYGIDIDWLSNFFSLAFTCFPLSLEHSLYGIFLIPSHQKYLLLTPFLQQWVWGCPIPSHRKY